MFQYNSKNSSSNTKAKPGNKGRGVEAGWTSDFCSNILYYVFISNNGDRRNSVCL